MSIEAADFAGLLREEVQTSMFESYDSQQSKIPALFDVIPFSQAPKKSYWVDARAVKDSKGQERRPGEDVKKLSAREARRIPYAWKQHAGLIEIPDELTRWITEASGSLVSDRAADSILEFVRPEARWFGEERARREEELAAEFFNNGGLTAGHAAFDQTIEVFEDAQGKLCYDGTEAFNLTGNARAAVDGTTYFNAVALSLTATNLSTVMQRMESSNCFDEMGRTIHLRAGQLIVPPALKQTAIQIVSAQALAGTGNNDANPYADLDVVVWNHLTDTDAWFVQDPTRKAFRWYEGGPPMVKVEEKAEFVSKIAVQSFHAANLQDWRGIVASNVSAS